ncbi:hypothetical protein [Roseofilum sp. Guam]|uniref:hypothetical protein n=1 Tax=Roseofilum sp. Guam TaxID=2821502 RepID=UPI001B03C2D2|nr:hypothetical protein [Roseofilum sp. Guam]MBP0031193.1 hypothetical protein [Roseofilum sp. Guam]
MNRDRIETLIIGTTVALFEYDEFACEKKCSLSPRLQAALSLLGEIRKNDFDLVEPSECDFGALIVPEEVIAVLAECGNGDPSLGFCLNEHIRMSFQFFLEEKGLLKEAEAFAMSRIKEFFPDGTLPQQNDRQIIVLGKEDDSN